MKLWKLLRFCDFNLFAAYRVWTYDREAAKRSKMAQELREQLEGSLVQIADEMRPRPNFDALVASGRFNARYVANRIAEAIPIGSEHFRPTVRYHAQRVIRGLETFHESR
jgi:hypothetical protein